MISQLEPWSFQIRENFHLRGWRTPFRGKPLIHFLHGNGFCGLTYSPMLAELMDDFDLILTDLPGHGDSDSGGRFMGWNKCADHTLSLVTHFFGQIDPTVPRYALGHSFGGVITAMMMGREERRFHKALLMDPVIFPSGMIKVMAAADLFGLLRRAPLAQQAKARIETWSDRESAFKTFHNRGGFKGWSDEALQAHVDYALMDTPEGVTLKCSPKREAAIYSSYPKRLWSTLAKVQTPTKVMMAEQSWPFIARSAEKLKEYSAYEIDTFPGSHCFMQEDPKATAQKIKEWFLG